MPFSSGKISAIALADPVVVGIKLCMHPLALLKSPLYKSTGTCVFVTSWIVVIAPCLIEKFSLTTFTMGAKQLVVHDAAVINLCLSAL